VLYHFLWRRRPAQAAAALLVWAYALGACMTLWTVLMPERAETAIWNAEGYRDEMFAWLRTGEGAEGDARRFLPQHAAHFAAFAAVCIPSAGAAGLLLGVCLLDYMAFYVGSLCLASGSPWLAALLGWHPWALLRVAGFILWGVALSSVALERMRAGSWRWRQHRRFLDWGSLLLVLDVLLKALLAGTWREMILRHLGWP
jgi:hypothetical protein